MFKKKPIPRFIALAACAFTLTAGKEVQLLPAGEFRASDGRPKDAPAWHIDAEIAAALIAKVDARANRLVLDYEHQTLLAADNGHPAPAAGWFKKLEWREGDGLYAVDVEWTARAAAMIEAGEYLYISPVFSYDKKTGAVVRLVNAALTNNPALDGMDAVAAKFLTLETQEESLTMDIEELLNQLRWMLNMPALATAEEITAELQKAVDFIKAAPAAAAANFNLVEFLTSKDTEIAALKIAAPDLAKYVPVEIMTDLRNQVAALTAQINGKTVGDLVDVALSDGRLLPAQESWARDLGESNLAALTGYLDTAQPIVALNGTQTNGRKPEAEDGDVLSESDLAICKNMGIDPEAYKKTKIEAAAV